MWLEHLLFGARSDADNDARGLKQGNETTVVAACLSDSLFFILRLSGSCRKRRTEFIDKFEKDNEVKKNKKQIDQFF